MRKKLAIVAALGLAAIALGVVGVHALPARRTVTWAQLSVITGGAIPRQPDSFIRSNPVVGLAWADLDSGKVR